MADWLIFLGLWSVFQGGTLTCRCCSLSRFSPISSWWSIDHYTRLSTNKNLFLLIGFIRTFECLRWWLWVCLLNQLLSWNSQWRWSVIKRSTLKCWSLMIFNYRFYKCLSSVFKNVSLSDFFIRKPNYIQILLSPSILTVWLFVLTSTLLI